MLVPILCSRHYPRYMSKVFYSVVREEAATQLAINSLISIHLFIRVEVSSRALAKSTRRVKFVNEDRIEKEAGCFKRASKDF